MILQACSLETMKGQYVRLGETKARLGLPSWQNGQQPWGPQTPMLTASQLFFKSFANVFRNLHY